MAQSQFNYTFVELFNEELSQRLGCTFTMQPLTSTRSVLALLTVFVLHQLGSLSGWGPNMCSACPAGRCSLP